MKTQERIRQCIRDYCEANAVSFAELSRQLGRDYRYISSAVNRDHLNIGHGRLMEIARLVPFPADLIEQSAGEQKARDVSRYQRIKRKHRCCPKKEGPNLLEIISSHKARPHISARAWA